MGVRRELETSLSRIADPAPQIMWAALREVLDASRSATPDDVDRALDVVVRVLGADRGFLVLGAGDADVVVHARAGGEDLADVQREELSRSLVRLARRERRTVAWDGLDAEASGSLQDLGIGAALAVPLVAGAEVLGTLYVDVSGEDKCFGPMHEDFVETAASLLAHVVAGRRALEVAEDRAEQAERAATGVAELPLHELLDPPSMTEVAADVRAALASSGSVLILGESGVGKTQLAAALAQATGRGRVVRATLGASDDLNTITSELFGHLRGAFSGAVSTRRGVVEHADGGVLILDEILNLPWPAQQLLLDFTQFGTYRPLGHDGAEPRRADVRIIAATNGDLGAAIREGRFREDLYYRLADHVIQLPPLRERRGDVPALADAILRRLDPARDWALSLELRRGFARSPREWSGNVRELASLVRRARGRALAADPDARRLELAHFDGELGHIPDAPAEAGAPAADEGFGLRPESLDEDWRRLDESRAGLDAVEADLLRVGLAAMEDNVSALARRLGVPRTTLLGRMRALGIGD